MNTRYQKIIDQHWPSTEPQSFTSQEVERLSSDIADLLKAQNAVIVAHYYVDEHIQALAEDTGGVVADSLEMARFGAKHSAKTLLVAGVRFMGETAKILSPEKTVLMPTLEAECSLDLSCPIDDFSAFCDQHPDRTVVVYANTSAAVKARADWVVTSSIALEVAEYLDSEGQKILWAPDQYLGQYIQSQTGADMVLWDGACVVHEEFKANALMQLKTQHPEAAILVHPESPMAVVDMADAVGSTSHLLKASAEMPHDTFIVATDRGIFYKMQQASPQKRFIEAPTGGAGATCRSCAHCPWMAMNSLERVAHSLKNKQNEVFVPEDMMAGAKRSLQRMLDFKAAVSI